MRHPLRPRASFISRAVVAATLLAATLGLSACVSDTPGVALGIATTPTPVVPTQPPQPTQPPPPTPLPTVSPTKPVAIVAGTPIPGSAYNAAFQQQMTFQTQRAAQSGGQTQPPTEQQVRSIALNQLVVHAMLDLYAGQHGITATAAEVQAQYNATAAANGGATGFAAVLQQYGFTPQSYKAQLSDNILLNKIVPAPKTVEQVRARHILVPTLAQADSIEAQLRKNPGSFAALARKYSTDTGSGANGGELGYFSRGAMVPPFEQAAFSQRIGEIGPPIHSQFGYHIIQVEARRQTPFARLDQQTQQAYRNGLIQQWIHQQEKLDHVQVLVPGVTLT